MDGGRSMRTVDGVCIGMRTGTAWLFMQLSTAGTVEKDLYAGDLLKDKYPVFFYIHSNFLSSSLNFHLLLTVFWGNRYSLFLELASYLC